MEQQDAAQDTQEVYRQRLEQLRKQQEMEQKAKALLKSYLTSEAYERMANIRISNPELYSQLLSLVAYLAQQGKISSTKRMGEEELKQFASKVVAKTRHETTITRRNK